MCEHIAHLVHTGEKVLQLASAVSVFVLRGVFAFLRVTRITILHLANREKVTEEMAMGLMLAKCV